MSAARLWSRVEDWRSPSCAPGFPGRRCPACEDELMRRKVDRRRERYQLLRQAGLSAQNAGRLSARSVERLLAEGHLPPAVIYEEELP